MTTTVSQLLETKGSNGNRVWSVTPQASVQSAMQLMADKDIGAVMVAEGDRLIGIFSERDYARKVGLKGLAPDTPVSAVMTSDVIWVGPDQSLEACMALMTTRFIRHLPVLDQGRLAGMITIRDVVKAMVSDRDGTIRSLETYLTNLTL
jgi:CBS domain-containing protein